MSTKQCLKTDNSKKEVVHRNTWGYIDSNEVASDLVGGIHESLLKGYYVFAYRGTGDIKRLVVTRLSEDTWSYGMVTSGWTCLIPRIPREFLIKEVTQDMITRKISKEIIEDFKYYALQ